METNTKSKNSLFLLLPSLFSFTTKERKGKLTPLHQSKVSLTLKPHSQSIWSTTSPFLLPTIEEAKSWHPYDIGDMSYHFFTLTVSHLDFLTHAGRVFLQLRQHLTTPQFHFQILIFAHVTKLRNMWEGSAHTRCTKYSKVENSPKNRWFFSAQKGWILYDFVSIYIGWSKCWPSISSSSQLSFAHHSSRCLLSTLEFLLSIKHRILVYSSKNL
jgi:hypothetical protein